MHPDPSEDLTKVTEDGREVETEGTEPDSNTELQPMDWLDFDSRYRDAIQKAYEEEDALLLEFEKYVEVSRSFVLLFSMLTSHEGIQNLVSGYSSA